MTNRDEPEIPSIDCMQTAGSGRSPVSCEEWQMRNFKSKGNNSKERIQLCREGKGGRSSNVRLCGDNADRLICYDLQSQFSPPRQDLAPQASPPGKKA